MPVYDYACTQCGRTIEVIHGVHAHGPSTCEVCGGAMRKVLSPPAIVFKGSGWAKKDAQAASRARSGAKSSTSTAAKPSAPAGDAGAAQAGGSAGSASSSGSGAQTGGSTAD